MSDIPDEDLPEPPPEDHGHMHTLADGQLNGIEYGLTPEAVPVPVQNHAPTLLDFVLQQLPLQEQMGFLRGNIILLSARLGTPDGEARDGERLDQFNFLFQTRLREMIQQNAAQQEKVQADMENIKRQGDMDARTRGFSDTDDMVLKLKQLYESIVERVRQWHASTEPGGDPLAAPETDALLYDVYLVLEGRAR